MPLRSTIKGFPITVVLRSCTKKNWSAGILQIRTRQYVIWGECVRYQHWHLHNLWGLPTYDWISLGANGHHTCLYCQLSQEMVQLKYTHIILVQLLSKYTQDYLGHCVTLSNYRLLPQDTPPQINAKYCLTWRQPIRQSWAARQLLFVIDNASSSDTAHFQPHFKNNTLLLIYTHYVYPCQRFSTGNTLEDYNP
jgi:hypothetical protein